MAITKVGTTQSAGVSGTGPHSVTYPSTTVGDVIVICVALFDSSVTWDTGVDDFTQFFNEALATNDPRITAAYHVIDGDENASFTFETSGGPGGVYWAFALRGADQTTPIGTVGSPASNTSSATTAVPSITTAADGNFAVVFGCSSEADGSPSSVDNSFTEDDETTIGSGGSGAATNGSYKEITSAGAVGTTTITWNGTDRNIGLMFEVNIESAGGDDLLADDIESSSEVTSPSIGQVHSITADDVESSSEVGSPAISQVHSLTADDVESTSEVSSPALAESHDLTADDVESSSEVTSPSISQVHAITADDVESQSEVSSPAVGQVHALTADDVESASEVSSPTLQSGNHALTADDVESQSELTSPALTQVHALLADDVESVSEVDVPVLNREVSSGGHFMPGLAGIRAGKRREPREAFQEAAEITERVIDEVLPPVEEKPVQRVSRKQKAAIIEQAAEAFREQQVFIGELHALDRAADLISKIALKRRREALRQSQRKVDKESAQPVEAEPVEDEEELFVLLLMVANL